VIGVEALHGALKRSSPRINAGASTINLDLCALILQVPRRTAEQIQFYLQFSDNHVEPRQLYPLQSFHSLLQAKLKPLQDLNRR